MDSFGASEATDTAVYTILRSQNEWLAFLRQIRGLAVRYDHWDHVDPSADVAKRPKPPARPEDPDLSADVGDNEVAMKALELKIKVFQIKQSIRKDWETRENKINAAIDRTTSKELKDQVGPRATAWERLVELCRLVRGNSIDLIENEKLKWQALVSTERCRQTDLLTWIAEVEHQYHQLDVLKCTVWLTWSPYQEVLLALSKTGYEVNVYRNLLHD